MNDDLLTKTEHGVSDLLAAGGGDPNTDIETMRCVPEGFCVEDERSANWLVKQVIAARQYSQKVKDWAIREQRRAEREEKTLMYLFGRQLEMWAADEIKKLNGRRKSICLPAGTLAFRRHNAALAVDDEVAVLEWARKHCPEAIQISERLSRSVLKDHFNATGEMPSTGAYVEPAKDKFSIL